jgi:FkbM family methyltransferase
MEIPNAQTFPGKLIRFPLALVPKRLVVRVRSGSNRGFRWIVGSSVHGCWLGTYETEKQRAIRRDVRPGMVAYDLGAQAGFYTLMLSRLVGPTGRVIAFEPYPENGANLLRHLRMNAVENALLLPVAVSAAVNLVASFEASSHLSMGRLCGEVRSRLCVPTLALDDLCRWGLPAPDLMKMDVEGAEIEVLEGAATLLAQRKTIWHVSLHGRRQRDECVRLLRDSGYALFTLDGASLPAGHSELTELVARPPEGDGARRGR